MTKPSLTDNNQRVSRAAEKTLPQAAEPIFVMGMMPRSGSHFLGNLLCLHPACTKSVIAEDLLLARADLLAKYVNALHADWAEVMTESQPGDKELLYACLGEGLTAFLQRTKNQAVAARLQRFNLIPPNDQAGKRLVTKTPWADNLDYFFRLFPRAHLLILIRDGRAVVESCAASFQYDREEAMRHWARMARAILQFRQNPRYANGQYLVVRYEDLHTQTEREMRKILKFLGLEIEAYDFQAALNLPVVGSSTFKRGAGKVHWLPVQKTPEFKPLARADGWGRAWHERFNWLAAAELAALGYEQKSYSGQRLRWSLWNRWQDLRWGAKMWWKKAQQICQTIRRMLKAPSSLYG